MQFKFFILCLFLPTIALARIPYRRAETTLTPITTEPPSERSEPPFERLKCNLQIEDDEDIKEHEIQIEDEDVEKCKSILQDEEGEEVKQDGGVEDEYEDDDGVGDEDDDMGNKKDTEDDLKSKSANLYAR
ncbi:hypothetical protein C2G38_2190876 [Gigaspora rosea]|uniref:Uncharacterized protein n=1 Tax=Gigaspora rosea TaxID=44941 RepID=A0A397V0R6_9GLOM